MEDKNIISGVVDALTGKPLYKFTISVKYIEEQIHVKRTWLDKLFRRPLPTPYVVETERDFEIWPCIVGNQYRIASKALSLPGEIFEDHTSLTAMMLQHMPAIVYIIAAAVQNNHLEPEAELIEFIERNFDNLDIFQALAASLQNMNMQSFLNSIVLMSGTTTILKPKASPQDGSE